MNYWNTKTPEELEIIKAKSAKTRADNAKKKQQAKEEKKLLRDEIRNLKREIKELKGEVKFNEAAKSLTGDYLLTERQIVRAGRKINEFTGIYFLIRGSNVVYVGQSKNIYSRIAAHSSSKSFDSMAWIACNAEKLDSLESLYIHFFKPELNGGDDELGKLAPIKLTDLIS